MSLKDHLIARIRQTGPLTIADYTTECMLHPELGYYTTRDPLGQLGDFVTAPEISQMFGELIGLSLAQSWLDQGSPRPFVLAELGPGRGTLIADILRATRAVTGFNDAAQIILLEVSPALRKIQRETLQAYTATWIETIADLPKQPLFLVANEFFDALPIRQFIRNGDAWNERLVGLNETTLKFGLGTQANQPALDERLTDTKDGDLVELCSAAIPVVSEISDRISRFGGAALMIDYGDWRSLGDTFQALHSHQRVDPLASPGQADLTAHVDFEPLAQAAQTAGCRHTRLTPQGVFLERLGITARAQNLAASMKGKAVDELIAAHRRLTHPQEMGNLFKVLGLYPAQSAPPPGLEP
ncbi:MAG: class I SAM-dependent methyltransferase [Ruegeria sp.]